MLRDYIFVSCDIVAHSAEASLERQRDNIVDINRIVSRTIQNSHSQGIVWASGGDGGHTAFPADGQLRLAVELILDLRRWSNNAGVNLRITANHGAADAIEGADGRDQLVGHGINLAGRLLPFGSQSRVIATEGFARIVADHLPKGVVFHNKQMVKPTNLPAEDVYLLSAEGEFTSTWDTPASLSDRMLLRSAIEGGRPLEAIYRAKRLLQINFEDSDAINALRFLASKRIRLHKKSSLLHDLLLDEQFGLELVGASSLIERWPGETICEFGDVGATMFLILKGNIGVFLPKTTQPIQITSPPPDVIMSPGELAGELAFALRRPRTATLSSLEDTALLAFNYAELIKSVNDNQLRVQIEDTLKRMMLSRVIENVWNTSNIFHHETAASPLAVLTAPWLTLLRFSEMTTIEWSSRTTSLCNAEPRFEGISLLVSGQVQVKHDGRTLDGKNYPIICANFPDEVVYQLDDCRLVDEVKLLSIRKEGLKKLGVKAYREIIQQIFKDIPPQQSEKDKMDHMARKHVFLSYCHDNKTEVAQLHDELMAAGEAVWWDENILGGQDWKQAIRRAMKESYAVVLCLSQDLAARIQSGVYPEVLDAITAYRQQAPGSIFLIPVRLSDCNIPDIEIDDLRTLDSLQTIDLFPEAKRFDGLSRLLTALKAAPGHP